jgi:2-methylcitrate dehydratase PrpD
MPEMTRTPQCHELARFLAGLQLTDLPVGAPELLKLCLLDTIGCAFGGPEAGKVTKRYLKRVSNSGSCTVIGSTSGAAPEVAALANGVLAMRSSSMTYIAMPSCILASPPFPPLWPQPN